MPHFKSFKSCQKVAKVVKNCKSCQKATKVANTKKLSIHSLFKMVEAHENMFHDQVDLLQVILCQITKIAKLQKSSKVSAHRSRVCLS